MSAETIVARLVDGSVSTSTVLGIVLRSGADSIEVVVQQSDSGDLNLPGGTQARDESCEEAVARLVADETGISTHLEWLSDSKKHSVYGSPVRYYFAVVPEDTETDSSVGFTWRSVKSLGKLSPTDRTAVLAAAKKVYDVDSLVQEALAECSKRFPVQALNEARVSRGSKGLFVAVEGTGVTETADLIRAYVESANRLCYVAQSNLSLVTESSIHEASRLRKLTPLNEALLRAADRLYKWDHLIQPNLDEDRVVIVSPWVSSDKERCLNRKLDSEILEAVFKCIPNPDVTIHATGATPDEALNWFKDALKASGRTL